MASASSQAPFHGGWHRHLAFRYTATLVAVALVSAGIVGIPLYGLAYRQLEIELADRLEGTAELSALLIERSPGNRTALLDTLRDEADLDAICVVDVRGTVTATSSEDDRGCAFDAADLLVAAQARSSDSNHTAIRQDHDNEPYLYAFAPLGTPEASDLIAVRGSAPYLARLQALRALFAGAGGIWIAVVLVLGVGSANRLVRPVRRLLDATERLRAGAPLPPPQVGGPMELDALEAAFASMAKTIRERETHLRALAGAVAHEVRNPSHAIRLHLGLLRRQLPPGDPARERVDVLDRELDLLEGTVEAFLVFARDQVPTRTEADLHQVVAGWADGAPVDAPHTLVSVDAQLVGRAVANLVRNAREAGGEPVIRARAGDPIVIEVEDHGQGFAPGLAGRAFEPFISGRAGGSGLGLAIVQAIARAHGGDVTLNAEPGTTVIRMTLAPV